MTGMPLAVAELIAFAAMPWGIESRMMPAAPAPVACPMQAAIALGCASPLQTWSFTPTEDSAVFSAAAVRIKPGICWTRGT